MGVVIMKYDIKNQEQFAFIKAKGNRMIHNWRILHSKDNLFIVKGGSWADSPV